MIDRRNLMAVGMAPFAGWTSARAFTEDPKPNAAPKTSREVLRDRYFPNVVLTTHEGKKVRFYDDLLKDKIVVLNFMYTSCEGVCPVITANLMTVQKLLGERVGHAISYARPNDCPSDRRGIRRSNRAAVLCSRAHMLSLAAHAAHVGR